MKSRKILAAAMAGLCAVSTMGVSAFAADEKIETSGAKSYKISAGFQAPTIDVTVPESVLGVINPYKIPVVIEGVTFVSEGIASPKYTITNNSAEVGINVKATYSAEGLDGVVATSADALANNTDKKKLAYVTLNATSPLDITDLDNVTAATGDITPIVVCTTEATSPLMRLNVAATGSTDNAGKFWIGGDVIEEPAEKWASSDKLSINVVLDINPFNTGATGGGVTTTARVTGATATAQGTAIAASDIVVNSTTKTITITSGASVGNSVAVTLTLGAGNTLGTVTATDSSKLASPTASGNVISGTFIAAGGGFTVLVNDGTDDETWTVTIN